MIICSSIENLLDSMELTERFEKAHQSFGQRRRRGKVIPRIESYQIPDLDSYSASIEIHGPYSYVPDFLVLRPEERFGMGYWYPQHHLTVLPSGVFTRAFTSRQQDRSIFEQEVSGKLIMTDEDSIYISNGDEKIRKVAVERQLEKFLEKPLYASKWVKHGDKEIYVGNNKIVYSTDKCLEEIREGLNKLGAKRIEL